jgi:exodeoxyribonuclease V gamma subunit
MAELLGTKDDDPWDPDRLVWPLLDVIDASLGQPWCRTLARHLGEEHTGVERELRRSRRYGVARRIAGLFGAYASQRPSMLTKWGCGDDADLDQDVRWQGELYRRLLQRVESPAPDARLSTTIDRLRNDPTSFGLPQRISFLGYTRLATADVMLLDALSNHRDVHLWLPHASPAVWDALSAQAASGPIRRIDDPAPVDAPNRLLISLGRDSRELQRMLHLVRDVRDEHLTVTDERPDSLLGWLHDDLINNRSGADGRTYDEHDRSIQVHACHGKARQVDVLREVLVGLLADDPTLEPRDILIMCPDIETYAPLIHAAFGLGGVIDDAHPAHQLRVRLADRGSASTNPLLQVATTLVALAESGRMTAAEVLSERLHNANSQIDRLMSVTKSIRAIEGFFRRFKPKTRKERFLEKSKE